MNARTINTFFGLIFSILVITIIAVAAVPASAETVEEALDRLSGEAEILREQMTLYAVRVKDLDREYVTTHLPAPVLKAALKAEEGNSIDVRLEGFNLPVEVKRIGEYVIFNIEVEVTWRTATDGYGFSSRGDEDNARIEYCRQAVENGVIFSKVTSVSNPMDYQAHSSPLSAMAWFNPNYLDVTYHYDREGIVSLETQPYQPGEKGRLHAAVVDQMVKEYAPRTCRIWSHGYLTRANVQDWYRNNRAEIDRLIEESENEYGVIKMVKGEFALIPPVR